MFATDQAPGVYYQSVDAGSPPVTPLRTDICALVGIAERGPVDVPVPIQSWQQFISWFGGCIGEGYLAYAVRGFLENGGRRCWVVRVASNDPVLGSRPAAVDLAGAAGPVWRVRASSDGTWGNQLSVSLRERNLTQAHARTHDPDGRWSRVPSVAGFTRSTLVRLSQAGSPLRLHRVVSWVDPVETRVHWVHPDQALRLPYDAPLAGFDPDRPILLETVDYRMLVSERGRLLRIHDGLSLVPESPRYGPALLPALRTSAQRLPTTSGAAPPEPVVIEELRTGTGLATELVVDPAATLPLAGGRSGLAALTAYDFVGEAVAQDDSDVAVAAKRRGLRAVEELTEVALLAVPDINIHPIEANPTSPGPQCVPDPCLDETVPAWTPPPVEAPEQPPVFGTGDVYRVQMEMVRQCELRRDRFALLDPPHDVSLDPASGIRGVLDWRARFDTSYASLSYPWLRVSDPVGGPGATRLIPPTGHVAGLVAATDLDEGVHRAPANRVIDWALGASVLLSDHQHALLNQRGVNAARTVGGRGLRLLGARTVSSDPDWVFVNVRRLMMMIEKALGIALQWAVFEPNGVLTRARATMSVTFFLDGLHEAGMLAGDTAEESFFVKCDLDNNPQAQRDIGQLLIEVGVAPVQPFEFVLLRVGRVTDSIEIREGVGSLGATGTEA
ncbi:MAG: phage tail sheath subtilisin-like domain-containing protein [Actinomycetota bacterium]|nr:phage tail sheath subtilisin-like domain-containing protein [Actinomycetota bacterium]